MMQKQQLEVETVETDRALEELAFHCKELRMLGSYRQAMQRG